MVAVLLWGPPTWAAGPFVTPPGNAERSYAGIAVAGPGSIGSAWHNPATLADAGTGAAVGLADAPERDRDGDLTAGSATGFAGASFVNDDKRIGAVAIGAAAYTPHTMQLEVARSGDSGSAFGRVDWTSQVVAVPYAVTVERLDLSVGVTGEVIAVDPGGSDLRVETASGGVRQARIDDDQGVGVSATLGLRYGLWEASDWAADIAAVAHLPATSATDVETDSRAAGLLLPDKPHGLTLGARLDHVGSDDGRWLVQVQGGIRRWGDAADIVHSGVSLGWHTPFPSRGIFAAGTRELRVGLGTWSAEEAEPWMDWPDGRALSAGVGYSFDTGVWADLSMTHQREVRDAFDTDSTWLLGISTGYVF